MEHCMDGQISPRNFTKEMREEAFRRTAEIATAEIERQARLRLEKTARLRDLRLAKGPAAENDPQTGD